MKAKSWNSDASPWVRWDVFLIAASFVVSGNSAAPRAETKKISHSPLAALIESGSEGLEAAKAIGRKQSSYQSQNKQSPQTEVPQPQLDRFRREIEPVLMATCLKCHGPEKQKGSFRVDTLDPDLIQGEDVNWWIEVVDVISNGEMPPEGEERMTETDRGQVIEWLTSEIQIASQVRRREQGHSSFRRMTRYEYNYALQDLLGLPYEFADDLPPEAPSEDGFHNSSEMLHLTAIQFATYRELGRKALLKATVRGDRPAALFWGVSMEEASQREWEKQALQLEKIRKRHQDDPETLEQQLNRQRARLRARPNGTHYQNQVSGERARASWSYGGAKYAWAPSTEPPAVPQSFDHVAVIPPRQRLIVELGDQLPEEGHLRVRVRASRTASGDGPIPSLQLEFGWQASNNSEGSIRISREDYRITATPDQPQFYQWDVPLSEIYPRNSVRKIKKMGDIPSPSEFIKLVNSSVSEGDIQLDYVEVTAPVYDHWPPPSHQRLFLGLSTPSEEWPHARKILSRFMPRAWRRLVTENEIQQKLNLFKRLRPDCKDFQEAMTEVLATVLASPKFLYLIQTDSQTDSDPPGGSELSHEELASRLAAFLWSSGPDRELMILAALGRLADTEVLTSQTRRMLADPRSQRFAKHFVRQWLDLRLLDFLRVDRDVHPRFDGALKEAMQQEPIVFFQTVLRGNRSVLDFLHADYSVLNERLARHYGLSGVTGNQFRTVSLPSGTGRGGLMTQAGLLAMNSDGTDSHPLKRGIWLLERILNDPPPPPPPAVPEIDLADPDIAKLSLKERMEDHRNDAACRSCHSKIDPWGIAFENFDAVGRWRDLIDEEPVDASSVLFNGQSLDGIDGLKRYLLTHRQDQFCRSLVYKLATYALGRPLSFGDRAAIDQITSDLRKKEDRLGTLITLIVTSELFRSQ